MVIPVAPVRVIGYNPSMTSRYLPCGWRAFEGPLLVLVWGMALGVLLWGTGVDVAIQVWLDRNYNQNFNTSMRVLGQLGKGSLQITLCVAIGALWAVYNWKNRKVGCRIVSHVLMAIPVFALAGAINWVLKWAIGRGRPKEFLWNGHSPYAMNPFEMTSQWWSFPSGHSCSTFAIAVWLGLAFPRFRWVFWVAATMLSFSRFLSLTPHYLGDVVAGAAIGASTAWACWILSTRRYPRKQKEGVSYGD